MNNNTTKPCSQSEKPRPKPDWCGCNGEQPAYAPPPKAANRNIGKRDPANYRIFRVYGDDPITDEQILDFIQKHRNRVINRYQHLWDVYRGDYDIYDPLYNPPKERWKEDNRVAVNFAEIGTSRFVGFNYGNPVKISYHNPAVDDKTSTLLTAEVNRIRKANRMNSLDAKTGTNAFIFGSGQRILYIGEDGRVHVINVSRMNGFPIYDDAIEPKLRYFVRLYSDDKNVTHGSISDDTDIRYFSIPGGNIKWEDEKPHGFPGVPAVIYDMLERVDEDYEPMGGFENVIPSMDDYNDTLSAKWNDIASFSNAMLKIKGPKVSQEMAQVMRDTRILNLVRKGQQNTDDDAEFMERPDGDGIQEHNLDRMEDAIFRQMHVTDVTDQSFATTSGIALQFKMTPMYELASTNWECFENADKQMWRLICGNPATPFAADDWEYLRYDHTMNFPADLSSEATNARNVDGIVSRKTQLASLSIVKDVDEEMAQIQAELSAGIVPINNPPASYTAAKDKAAEAEANGEPAPDAAADGSVPPADGADGGQNVTGASGDAAPSDVPDAYEFMRILTEDQAADSDSLKKALGLFVCDSYADHQSMKRIRMSVAVILRAYDLLKRRQAENGDTYSPLAIILRMYDILCHEYYRTHSANAVDWNAKQMSSLKAKPRKKADDEEPKARFPIGFRVD